VIVVDTNVVSQLMRPSPSSQVRDWIIAQAPGELCTTAVPVARSATASSGCLTGAGRTVCWLPLSRCSPHSAICRTRGAALATRNAKDFEETGIDVIDPWPQSQPADHTTPPAT